MNAREITARSLWITGAMGRRLIDLIAALALIALLLGAGTAQARSRGASFGASETIRPCDIDAAAGTPCVAAFSTVRLLSSDYAGPLYQVRRASDHAQLDVYADPVDGVADITPQLRFCASTVCTITELYDQSGERNELTVAVGHGPRHARDRAALADALPVRVDGQPAYGLDVTPGVGYRDDRTAGMAVGSEPQSVYMVTSSDGTDHSCCFDFGNAETDNHDDGDGHADAVNFSSRCVRPATPCPGPGPWVQADFEDGLFQSNRGVSANPFNPSIEEPFVTAMLKTDGEDYFALAQANAQSGPLTTSYAGVLPNVPDSDYAPMQQEGAIVLGIGGDNSRGGSGEFFEGVITAGMTGAVTDTAVQANVVAAGYDGSVQPPRSVR